MQRDLEQLVRAEAAAASTFVPRDLEVNFKGYELAPGVLVSGKIDRVDRDPVSARGIIVDYKSGAAPSAARSTRRRACRSRSTCSCSATSSGWSRWAASTCR